jgi:hypothetical protein
MFAFVNFMMFAQETKKITFQQDSFGPEDNLQRSGFKKTVLYNCLSWRNSSASQSCT